MAAAGMSAMDRLKAMLATFPEPALRDLRSYLDDILPSEAQLRAAVDPRERRETVTRRRELVRCGRAGCRCERPDGRHGPYWYEYWRDERGRLRKRYAGRVGAPARTAQARNKTEPPNTPRSLDSAGMPH